MSNFKEYAQRADEYAKQIFNEFKSAEKKYQDAEALYKANRKPAYGTWNTDAATIAKYARIEAEYHEAKGIYESVKNALSEKIEGFNAIRKELKDAIASIYAANPEHIDAATLELVKSGILTADEYNRFIDKAVAANNYTMARLIANSARERADAAAAQNDAGSAREYRAIAEKGSGANGSEYIQAFDYIADVFGKCANNTALMPKWSDLTSETINNF